MATPVHAEYPRVEQPPGPAPRLTFIQSSSRSDHDRADRAHRRPRRAPRPRAGAGRPRSAAPTASALRDGERHRRVDADPAVGGLFHRHDAGTGSRDLDDHVGCQRVEHHNCADRRSASRCRRGSVWIDNRPLRTALRGEESAPAGPPRRPRAPSTTVQPSSSSRAVGRERRERPPGSAAARVPRSFRITFSAITGLQVAPTPPNEIERGGFAEIGRGAESFHRQVGVSRAMRSRGGAAPGRSRACAVVAPLVARSSSRHSSCSCARWCRGGRSTPDVTVGTVRGARTVPTACGQPVSCSPTAGGCPSPWPARRGSGPASPARRDRRRSGRRRRSSRPA